MECLFSKIIQQNFGLKWLFETVSDSLQILAIAVPTPKTIKHLIFAYDLCREQCDMPEIKISKWLYIDKEADL